MQFIDEALIQIKSGDGGRGCSSFRREKYVPKGGPDGGNGGRGGHVIIEATRGLATLHDFKYKKIYRAMRGHHGRGKNQHGKRGEDLIIKVPEGTIVTDAETGETLGDLEKTGMQVTAAKGGSGGRGNATFSTSINQSPDLAEDGQEGEEKKIKLELRILAQVGIVGKPNAGKSTLIRRVSRARPKVADYPFTTMSPVLGTVHHGEDDEFVIAEIPGILNGASRGIGLGTRFLKHLKRTSVIVLMVDASSNIEEATADLNALFTEIGEYDDSMLARTLFVILNKIDLPGGRHNSNIMLEKIDFSREKIFPLSAYTGEGVETFLDHLAKVLENVKSHEYNQE